MEIYYSTVLPARLRLRRVDGGSVSRSPGVEVSVTPEDKSKMQSFLSDLEALKAKNPEEKKYKDCKEKVEKKLEEVFGKNSDQFNRFQRAFKYNFSRSGKPPDAPLSNDEQQAYFRCIDEAKRLLTRFN